MHLIPLATNIWAKERKRDEDHYLFVLQGSGPSNQYKRLGEEFSQGHLVISPGLIDFISPKSINDSLLHRAFIFP